MKRFPLILLFSFFSNASADETCVCGSFTYPRPSSRNIKCPLVTAAGSVQDPDKEQPLPEYPRPQTVRSGWTNLNGWWEFQSAGQGNDTHPPAFPTTPLTSKIVVPYPPESCLSGVWINHYGDEAIPRDNSSWTVRLWYRRSVFLKAQQKALLHFEASDYVTFVYLDRVLLGSHRGGYSRFNFEVFGGDTSAEHELLVYTYDPTDFGEQSFGKQRISAILDPHGDTYSPSSGIWQTVWLEDVPQIYIKNYTFDVTVDSVTLTVQTSAHMNDLAIPYTFTVFHPTTGAVVAKQRANSTRPTTITFATPINWTPENPNIYNATIALDAGDSVKTYFALRHFSKKVVDGVMRPTLNGEVLYLSGWLDQSFWPDGLYSAPTTDAMYQDISYAKELGFNMIRLHQKVNPQTWYSYADRNGMVVFQDMPQHYGDANGVHPSVALYKEELTAMLSDLWNVPSILQWTLFNENDMVSHFNVSEIVSFARNAVGTSRLLDADSGGPANNEHLADVNDLHHYPMPIPNTASTTQYAMLGEWGGLGYFVPGHEWVDGKCYGYSTTPTSQGLLELYTSGIETFIPMSANISASVITQTSDVERECDGFYTYDRIRKFNKTQDAAFAAANMKLRGSLP